MNRMTVNMAANDRKQFTFDYSQHFRVLAGETLATPVVTITGPGTDITKSTTEIVNGSVVSLWLIASASPVEGDEYMVTGQVTFQPSGEVNADNCFQIRISTC